MITSPSCFCLSCEAVEADVPLTQWQYQGHNFWICPDCLPIMIHKRHQLAEKMSAFTQAGSPPSKEK